MSAREEAYGSMMVYIILCDLGNMVDRFKVGTIQKYVDHMIKRHGLSPDLLSFCRDQVRMYVNGCAIGVEDDTVAWLSDGERRN